MSSASIPLDKRANGAVELPHSPVRLDALKHSMVEPASEHR